MGFQGTRGGSLLAWLLAQTTQNKGRGLYWDVSGVASDELGGAVYSVAGKFDGVGCGGWYADCVGGDALPSPFSRDEEG